MSVPEVNKVMMVPEVMKVGTVVVWKHRGMVDHVWAAEAVHTAKAVHATHAAHHRVG